MTNAELYKYVKANRPDLVSIEIDPNGGYIIGQTPAVYAQAVDENGDAVYDEEGQPVYSEEIIEEAADLPNLQEIIDLADNYIEYCAAEDLKRKVESALGYGQGLIAEFIRENLVLGITQAGRTKVVRKAMNEVISCLQTGSLYDAIDELRLIPAEDKDPTFITDVRILSYINKLETYLGITLSTEV